MHSRAGGQSYCMSFKFPMDNLELLKLIKKFMVYGPYGTQNNKLFCIENGTYTKGIPKPFSEHITIIDGSYARTKCHNTRQIIQTNRYQVDNR